MSGFHSHVRKAVQIVGGQAKLAAAIGCAQSEVSRLCNSAQSISHETALRIARATDWRVPLSDLLPDVVDAVRAELERATAPDLAPETAGAAA